MTQQTLAGLPSISTVLGDSRIIEKTYEDGSYNCPYCCYAVGPEHPHCPNPACESNPHYPPDKLQAIRDERDRRKAEEESRKALAESVAETHRMMRAEHQQWEKDQIAECRKRGACLRCLFQSGYERVKFIKHRGACPKERS